MAHSPRSHTRAGSRASLASVGQMPVIKEDSNTTTIPTSPTTPPPILLRVPAKNPRRSLCLLAEGTGIPYVAGFQDMPPGALTPAEAKEEVEDGDEETIVGQMTPTPPVRLEDGEWDNRGWRPNNMQRRCHYALVMAVAMVILVGLAVGLSLGLTKTHGNNQDTILPALPTGAFTFDTILQSSSAACISNPNAWRCLPYEEGPQARFNWTIKEMGLGYAVSSSNDPIASSFENVPLALFDAGEEDERFTFSFKLNITAEPPITASNRAAKCTYTDTTLHATIWTRRGRQRPYSAVHGRSSFVNWPGLVEIAETKNATLGVPDCVDSQGNTIADVQAGMGICECVYRTKEWI
ncbi:tat pathway signal sequence [Trichoderma arundinaceum]|uniref:Tat pathway signal sequence n=1 Tax=Trichoderma arundinaceum TaxID=490622 RepID=A0A395NFP3_TRIAR|nr:tat pathway signal sequence [Trichoderma arundinaceum]